MKRRPQGLGGAIAWPLAAWAQEQARMLWVGVLTSTILAVADPVAQGFVRRA